MSNLANPSRGEIVGRIHEIDPSFAAGISVPMSVLVATLADLTSDDTNDEKQAPADFYYAQTESAPAVVGSFALHTEDVAEGVGQDGIADEAMATDVLDLMVEHYGTVDQTDDDVRYVHTKDGKIKGAAPRLMVASILGFTTEDLAATKVWQSRSQIKVWDLTTGASSYLGDVEAKLADAPTVKVLDEKGVPVPVIRPTGRVVDFAIPVTNVQRAISVYYRDSAEKHDAISGLRLGSFLGVMPSGQGVQVKSFVDLKTIARVLVNLGVGLPSQASDSNDDMAEGSRPLVMFPAFDPAIAEALKDRGYNDEGVNDALSILAYSKYALAAARASGRKVRANDESARRAQDGRHHEFRLRDQGGDAVTLADVSVAAARAAR